MTAPEQRARQRRLLLILGPALIAGGLAVLFFVTRMPLPLRIVVGLTDVVAGCVLLLVARQKFSR
ncbi:MAG: hypothetical protein JNK23_07450 [Opitutaceae bacterium]|nr:hypothetical protein [Opitutaceae bacterium]